MRKHPFLLVAILGSAAGLSLASPLPISAQSPQQPTTVASASQRGWTLRQTPVVKVVQRVRDAVVNIHSERTARGPAAEELFSLGTTQNRINGMGTGIIIDPRGYIVTNQHVVEEVATIRVRLANGDVTNARVVARDNSEDLALLKVDYSRPLPTMPLGTAQDIMVGETVVAIGNAYGYEHTVSVGVVSATGRDVTLNKDISYRSLIQTDAAINPGNSGGPLINLDGQLVGVNVAIRAGAQGIGFAIPVDTMIRVTSALMREKTLAEMPGLQLRDEVDTREGEGWSRRVLVDQVEPEGLAARAGLRAGDELLQVTTTQIRSTLDVERSLLESHPGDQVKLRLRRDGKEMQTTVTLQGQAPRVTDMAWKRLGLRLEAARTDTITRDHPQLHGGLVVMDLHTDGAAAKAGIQRGDILVGLHQWEMLTPDNVQFVLKHPQLQTFLPLRFYIVRGGQVHRGWISPTE